MRPVRIAAFVGLGLLLGCSSADGDGDPVGESSSGGTSTTGTSGEASSMGPDEASSAGPTSVGSTSASETTGVAESGETTEDTTGVVPTEPPFEDVRNYIFGHSLILHSPTANVPRWLDGMADAAGYSYAMSGRYGFADTHAAELPPTPQWGIEGVDAAWDDGDGLAFGEVDFNTVLFTEANFRQYYPPTETDPDVGLPSSVESTLTVFDWVEDAESGVRFIVYENWPDMAGFTSADFVSSFPSADEMAAYHAFTQGDFHQWWLDYHDALVAQRPGQTIHMVPVGPVLAELLTSTLSDVPVEVFYEDDAPHGRPSLYFLAGLVTYMAVYAGPPPAGYAIPDDVDTRIRDRYAEIVEAVWTELQGFESEDGTNRVFG